MSRVLPAHVLVAAVVLGLVASDVVRIGAVVAVALALLVPLLAVAFGGRAVGVERAGPQIAGRLLLAGLAVGLLAWGWGSARLDALDRSPLSVDSGRAGRLVAVLTADPRPGHFEQRAFARTRSFDGRRVDERVQLELPLGRAPPQGAILSLLGVVTEPRGSSGGFDERTWLRRQGVHLVIRVDEWHLVGHRGGFGGATDRLRAWLRRASTPGLAGERRAVLAGIVLGDDAGLSDGLKTSFRRSGLYHLLAVSGQNVVLLAGGVLGLAWLLGIPRAWAHVGALAAIGAYVLAVGPQPSVIRAAVSGCAVSVAWLTSRERDPWHVLLLAAAVLLAWSPYALFDPGFQLSFVAVVAIFLAVGPVLRVLEGYPVPRRLAPVLAVSGACSVATAPILWLQFGQVPLLGLLANALVEPVVGALLGLALVAAAVDPVAPQLAVGLAWLDGWVAAYVVACARAVAALPFAQLTGRGAALAAAGALVAAAYAVRRWRTSSSLRT